MFRRHDLDQDSLEYWRRQHRQAQRARGRGPSPLGRTPATYVLIALCVVGALAPQLFTSVAQLPLGAVWLAVVSTVLPGSLLNLIFVGIFIWMLGTQVEPLDATWKFVLLFLVSGALGALAGMQAGGFVGSVSAFGLAGGYAYVMWAHNWTDRSGAWRWVVGLLVLNALLSLFNVTWLIAMVVAVAAGFGFAYVTNYGR